MIGAPITPGGFKRQTLAPLPYESQNLHCEQVWVGLG